MTYAIEIIPEARREWNKLDPAIKAQALRKLEKLLHNPRIASAKLRDLPDCYKIKLRSAGYRIIYRVIDERLIIMIVAAGKRDASKDDIYHTAGQGLGRTNRR